MVKAALTGTPGVGKTTTAELLRERGHRVVDVNALVDEGFHGHLDEERDSLVADLDGLREALKDEEGLLEGHLSHLLDLDLAIVLRCSPEILEERGLNAENVEAECVDVVLVEAVETCEEVHEVDTSSLSPGEVADRVERVLRGEEELPPGAVDWSDRLLEDRVG